MTSLSLSGLFLLLSEARKLPKKIHDEELVQMKVLILGSDAMLMLASAIVLMSPDQMSDLSQVLLSFIGGSIGAAAFISIYGTKTAQEIAAKTTSSVALAGFVSPFAQDQLAYWFKVPSGFRTLWFISGIVGFALPYLIRQYGEKLAEVFVTGWLKKAKDYSGSKD